jgi:hypothetical protein|tara:strand:- start:408 stop:599 length:192 start_codon:yes stop_codon:yes gene_type:complete
MYGGEIMNVFGITEKSIGFLISMFDKYHTDENYIRKFVRTEYPQDDWAWVENKLKVKTTKKDK